MNIFLSSNITSFFFLFLFLLGSSSARTLSSSPSSSSSPYSSTEFYGQTEFSSSDFRLLNRRSLLSCHDSNPYLQINIDSVSASGLSNDQNVTVSVSGVLAPVKSDWIGMISPSYANVTDCAKNEVMYLQTGDTSKLPLLCHYPVKAQYVSNDPDYLDCNNNQCQKSVGGSCLVKTCNGSLTFHVINIRTDIEFVFFTTGFDAPCILTQTKPVSFANPNSPLYGHLSSVDSTGQSMRLTWVSGDQTPQQVQFGNGNQTSQVTTFTQNDMCGSKSITPAKDFGWHDPGYIHTAVMTGLQPSTNYSYKYGSDSVGWSDQIQFRTPPAAGSAELRFLAYGDMGKAPHDASVEHYIQPGSIPVTDAMAQEVASGNANAIFHIGDISYATGFLAEWDFFLQQIGSVASRVSYMTAIGNHERDYTDSGSVYTTTDSGGECGVPYETYFPMPTSAKDKPWYSIEQGPVHFTVISTEHDWNSTSEQVDLALWGHVHNYERMCAVYQNVCMAMPIKDANGTDTYYNKNYSAPVHAVIGMAGFSLDQFPSNASVNSWSLVRISDFGYVRFHATVGELSAELVIANNQTVEDSFRIIKGSTTQKPVGVRNNASPDRFRSCQPLALLGFCLYIWMCVMRESLFWL
ncbi:hypothetical protein NE237_005309 [Protea cynaroides]|uniref:Purple acid phosphatase n=1 Tax=Protea cynaroides TaxID=273540 RepID=A0A9Q0QUF5_9MAGN|nr:hypothetical protein NE237_005309 [Protea cynaroides]